MAPADTPGKKKRDNNYFNVGVQGRKTGITLKDTGIRDEHGMEPLDGIFSSPEKSPPKRPSAKLADTTLTSSDMEVQQSSMPEPTDALSARKSLRPNRASLFPPPMGRSPIKTNIGSSPRRQTSMGPPSQIRQTARTPDRAASHPAVARRLDFGANDTRQSIEQTSSSGSRTRGKPRPNVYDLQPSPVKGLHDETIGEEELPEESEYPINGADDDSPLPGDDGDSLQILPNLEEPEDNEEIVQAPEVIEIELSKRRRGRPRKSLESATHEGGKEQELSDIHEPSLGFKKGRGRLKKTGGLLSAATSNVAASRGAHGGPRLKPATNGDLTEESVMDPDQPDEELSIHQQEETEDPGFESELAPKPESSKRKRTTAKKNSKVDVHKDETEEVLGEERPVKRTKKNGALKKPPPSQRDPNARITSSKKGSVTEKDAEKENRESRSRASPNKRESMPPPGSRSLQVLRQGTPFDDVGSRTTRSGRASVKPLNYWANERIEYSHDGTKQHIIRAEEVAQQKRGNRGRPRVSRSKRAMSEVIEEPELEPEEWEEDPGIVAGWVNGWDESQGAIVDEGNLQEDIAFSAGKIQTREVAGANFQYAKILGIPFFGAGMVDIPAHGSKRAKNSRRMHMAFCLISGKVCVTVADTEFSITKGGVWVVPRGEF